MIDITPYQHKLKVLELYMGLWIHVQCSVVKRSEWVIDFFNKNGHLPWSGHQHNLPPFDQFYEEYLENQHKMRIKQVIIS